MLYQYDTGEDFGRYALENIVYLFSLFFLDRFRVTILSYCLHAHKKRNLSSNFRHPTIGHDVPGRGV